tara:strand:+ start:98 stop:451 length:354 start_codon:yes stop_codon:yes gene_type:complete
MKLTKERLISIIKEEMKNFNEMSMQDPKAADKMMSGPNPVAQMSICDELVSKGIAVPDFGVNFADMSDEELVLSMCMAQHYKPFYYISMELNKRGYGGRTPSTADNSAFRKKMNSGV